VTNGCRSFATYGVAELADLTGGGVTIPFVDGHARQLPVITAGDFHHAIASARLGL
jgi:hypothetical protein